MICLSWSRAPCIIAIATYISCRLSLDNVIHAILCTIHPQLFFVTLPHAPPFSMSHSWPRPSTSIPLRGPHRQGPHHQPNSCHVHPSSRHRNPSQPRWNHLSGPSSGKLLPPHFGDIKPYFDPCCDSDRRATTAFFFTSGAFGLTGLASLSWVLNSFRKSAGKEPSDYAKQRLEMTIQVGEKTKQAGETITSKVAHELGRRDRNSGQNLKTYQVWFVSTEDMHDLLLFVSNCCTVFQSCSHFAFIC